MASLESVDTSGVCDRCDGPLDVGRYLEVKASSLSVYCSVPCFRSSLAERRAQLWATRRRNARRFAIAAILIGGWLTPHQRPASSSRRVVARAQPAIAPKVTRRPPLPPGWFGPEWPPSDNAILAELGRDAWIHPMAGPFRRMPRSDSRVFGAVRPGQRPIECRNGHCGNDLGGEIWGEHVRAAHDGVVDWVQRSLNPEHGGRFVRLSHRNGTVFTQYFHLAAIPRGIERGKRVKSGDLIGLLGDSGVKESAPHLHFTVSIRSGKDRPERYIDPEPLIALWPLRVPIEGGESGLVTTVGEPGLPLGGAPLGSRKRREEKARQRGSNEVSKTTRGKAGAASSDATSTGTAPSDETPGAADIAPETTAEEPQD